MTDYMTSAAPEPLSDGRGEAALLSFLYPLTRADMNESQRDAFDEAVLLEEAFLAEQKEPGLRQVRSEAVGDVKVTYGTAGAAASSGGTPISHAAMDALLCAGLLRRWL